MSMFDKLNNIGHTGRHTPNADVSIDLKRISKLDSEGKENSYI